MLYIYRIISPYLAGFLAITTIAFLILSVYRGEIFSNLQREILINKDQEIKVIIERNDLVADIATNYEEGRVEREQIKEYTIKQVETIVKEPIYLSTCFDANGVSVLNGYIHATNASEHSATMQGAELAQ